MTQTLTSAETGKSLDTDSSIQILCSYTNITHYLQIIRLKYSPSLHWERVVFPDQRLMFEAAPQAQLEIYFSENKSMVLTCDRMRVTEKKHGVKLQS
jgi:hypothetical protein